MQLIRDIHRGAQAGSPTAVAVGNFDGVHLGHQALIGATLEGVADGLCPALMCFEPLPRTFFCPAAPVPRVLGVRDRIVQCRRHGVDRLFMLRFNARFAALTPEQFARDVLARGAQARRVIVGADFRFGAAAAGDVAQLRDFGRRFGFELVVVDAVTVDGERVSSSRIRAALGAGDVRRAAAALGRPYRLSGRVLRGRRLGRELGFATVNLRSPEPPALSGILAVRVHGAGLRAHPGVASLGRRPTVDGEGWLLEVHLFDYTGELYGRHLEVEFVAYLRPELKFEHLDAMREQMETDAVRARAALEN